MTFSGPVINQSACGIYLSHIIRIQTIFPKKYLQVCNHASGKFPFNIGQNFEKFRNSKIHYHSIKEHLKLSKTAKFGCEM